MAIKKPSKNKLKGDALKLWNILVKDYGVQLKQRHSSQLFAMCQQWGLYQDVMAKMNEETDDNKLYKLSCRMASHLKQYNLIAKRFAMGINDQLIWNGIGSEPPGGKSQNPTKTKSRLGNLLSEIGASKN